MPEGPEVETIRRNLEERLQNQVIESVWRSTLALRTPTKTQSFRFLEGARVRALLRLGKVLVIETDHGRGLLIRFGMSGRLFFPKVHDAVENHTHLRMRFKNSDYELRYIDPRRFGDVQPFQDDADKEALLAEMGPDGLSLTESAARILAKRIRLSHRPIKAVLLDQNVVSGIGNIYACEALHLARVSPLSLACDLAPSVIERILLASKQVMKEAVSHGGTTFLSYLDGNGQKGANQNRLRVFARENKPCHQCGQKILRIVQSGRSTFYCDRCQK